MPLSARDGKLVGLTREEVEEIKELLFAEWEAKTVAEMLRSDIERRVEAGATVQEGELYFDRKLRRVRRMKGDGPVN